VCLQDYPAVTGAYMSVPVFSQIVRELPQVVMLKAEDQPGLTKISRIRALEAQGQRRVSILVGNNGLFYPLELARGADGAMTGVAYPEMLTEVYQAMQRRQPRPGRRPVRDLPADGALRDAGRCVAGLAQGDPAPARRHRQRQGAIARGAAERDEHDDLTRMMARIASKTAALKKA
jgi:4-hydroxy-tetrahydrodipicolinate synthase